MDAFNASYKSFSVNTKTSKAKQLVAGYQVDGVPSFGVGGKFYTDGQLAKGNTRALAVVEHLAGVAKKSA
jgi:thiol:disulfide interchange protein DsbA